jgi:hypothetical protein
MSWRLEYVSCLSALAILFSSFFHFGFVFCFLFLCVVEKKFRSSLHSVLAVEGYWFDTQFGPFC